MFIQLNLRNAANREQTDKVLVNLAKIESIQRNDKMQGTVLHNGDGSFHAIESYEQIRSCLETVGLYEDMS